MIGQSRIHSLIESFVNILAGYLIALAAQLLVFPLFSIHIPLASNLAIGAIFTVVSLCRSYALRRAFNWWHVHQHRREAVHASAHV